MESGTDVVAAGTGSKFFCGPGWRIGWLASRDEAFIKRLDRLAQSATISSVSLSQDVFAAALQAKHRHIFKDRIAGYEHNCDVMTKGIVEAGLLTQEFADTAGRPDGAFYRFLPS